MILQNHPQGKLAISQPCHAWLSEQLARQWNQEILGKIDPFEQLCLAASQHDSGWTNWETTPKLNKTTQYPKQFFELNSKNHLNIWETSVTNITSQNLYASLIVSLHLTHLCKKYELQKENSELNKTLIKTFLETQRHYQVTVMQQLLKDEHYKPLILPDKLNNNSLLLGIWDFLSLSLCMGQTDPFILNLNKTAPTIEELKFSPIEHNPNHFKVTPYPFLQSPLNLTIESKLITASITQSELTTQLKKAPIITQVFQFEE